MESIWSTASPYSHWDPQFQQTPRSTVAAWDEPAADINPMRAQLLTSTIRQRKHVSGISSLLATGKFYACSESAGLIWLSKLSTAISLFSPSCQCETPAHLSLAARWTRALLQAIGRPCDGDRLQKAQVAKSGESFDIFTIHLEKNVFKLHQSFLHSKTSLQNTFTMR